VSTPTDSTTELVTAIKMAEYVFAAALFGEPVQGSEWHGRLLRSVLPMLDQTGLLDHYLPRIRAQIPRLLASVHKPNREYGIELLALYGTESSPRTIMPREA
jgi:hypothetical protein